MAGAMKFSASKQGTTRLPPVTAALPEDTQNDIYRVILTGEAEPVETAALRRRWLRAFTR